MIAQGAISHSLTSQIRRGLLVFQCTHLLSDQGSKDLCRVQKTLWMRLQAYKRPAVVMRCISPYEHLDV